MKFIQYGTSRTFCTMGGTFKSSAMIIIAVGCAFSAMHVLQAFLHVPYDYSTSLLLHNGECSWLLYVTASIPLSEPFDRLKRSLRSIESDSVRVCNTPGYFGVAVGVSTVVTVSMFCEPEPPECSVVRKLVGA